MCADYGRATDGKCMLTAEMRTELVIGDAATAVLVATLSLHLVVVRALILPGVVLLGIVLPGVLVVSLPRTISTPRRFVFVLFRRLRCLIPIRFLRLRHITAPIILSG